MAIDFEKFLTWAESRFDTVIVKGDEVRVDSIFTDDHKQHMWCNPYGGKNHRENGVFRCWKTDRRGSLLTLVMLKDHCTYEEACEVLDASDLSLANLERAVDDFFDEKYGIVREISPSLVGLKLPDYTFKIDEMSPGNLYRVQAEIYLFSRKLSSNGLMICTAGDYKNRIVIPYYDQEGKLIYYNCRYIGTNSKVPKYLGPPKECGVGKGDVLYFPKWPQSGERVYLAEGEFDAMSICVSELNGGAFGGKSMGEEQRLILQGYQPTLCLDNDPAGKKALPELGEFLLGLSLFGTIKYVRPPTQYKDWNEMLSKAGTRLLQAYILRNEKIFDAWEGARLRFREI